MTTGGNELAIRPDVFHHQFAADVPAGQAAVLNATQGPVTQDALTAGLPTGTPAWRMTAWPTPAASAAASWLSIVVWKNAGEVRVQWVVVRLWRIRLGVSCRAVPAYLGRPGSARAAQRGRSLPGRA
ncbi:MAG TPA: hypothetical protein VK659_11590 [Asanoa sp.]|nr:hypothetical protein [Asanoa sp.]